ncbi:MAG: hypothetical protein NZO16_05370 [Deltaproteobacteria bacterium]|nr:hypothetical protein [Deltaproteobacteria bacterium]
MNMLQSNILSDPQFWELIIGENLEPKSDTEYKIRGKKCILTIRDTTACIFNGEDRLVLTIDDRSQPTSILLRALLSLTKFESKKCLIAGGTGYIGSFLRKALQLVRWSVDILSRRPNLGVHTDYERILDLDLSKYDLVINLCGENILKLLCLPFSTKSLFESRIKPTRFLARKLKELKCGPILVNASAIGYYDTDGEVDENTKTKLTNRISQLVFEWEREALEYNQTAIFRFGFVLGQHSPIFKVKKIFNFFPVGLDIRCQAWINWTCLEDILSYIALTLDGLRGPINVVSGSLTFSEFQDIFFRPKFCLPTPKSLFDFLNKDLSHLIFQKFTVKSLHYQTDFSFRTYINTIFEINKFIRQ